MIYSIIPSYCRPDNLPKIIQAIHGQTVLSRVVVFDNGGNYNGMDLWPDDIYISSSFNFNCLPRFFIPGWFGDCSHVWQNDDDHYIGDCEFLQRMMDESQKWPTAALVYNGRELADGPKSYQDGKGIEEARPVEVGNFGFSFYPSHLANKLPAAPYQYYDRPITFQEMRYADDLWASRFLSVRVSEHIKAGLVKMSEGSDAITLSKTQAHMDARNTIGKRFFK